MKLKVTAIREEVNWESLSETQRKLPDNKQPKFIMVELTPTNGSGIVRLPYSEFPNAEVGLIYDITFNSKKTSRQIG